MGVPSRRSGCRQSGRRQFAALDASRPTTISADPYKIPAEISSAGVQWGSRVNYPRVMEGHSSPTAPQGDSGSEELGRSPDPKAVASRADGRPPEEASSDDPDAQAQAILDESEERIGDGARASAPSPAPFPEPSEDQLEEEEAD